MRRGLLILVLILAAGAIQAPADEVTLSKPIPVEVHPKDSPRTLVKGQLIRYDQTEFTIRDSKKEDVVIAWSDLVPASAYNTRSKLIDKKKAGEWLELGRFGFEVGAKDDARKALATAVKMDPKLKEQADEILASATASSGEDDGGDGEMLKPVDASVEDSGESKQQPAKIEKYQKATPQQNDEAITRARDAKDEIEDAIDVKLTELQTDHFLIFTDWDKREHKFLKTNLEAAYAAVSKQFDIPVKENVFVGKLPVYMLNDQEDFLSFAHEIDKFPANKMIAGYYAGKSDGSGHMAMWKPDVGRNNGDVERAKNAWAYVLTHEFTHAFVARYRTNRRIPIWLNEGTAEVIASGQFQRPEAVKRARDFARSVSKIDRIFKAEASPSGEWYPVMRTLVETLIAKDRKAFLAMFNDIKDGMDPEEALQKNYKWDYAKLEQAWRAQLKSN